MSIFSIAKRATLVVAMAAALGACASSQIGGGNTVSRDATRGASAVEYGVVIDSRQVTIEGTRSGVGAATGVQPLERVGGDPKAYALLVDALAQRGVAMRWRDE